MKYSWTIEYLERKHGIAGSKQFMVTRSKEMSKLHHVPFTWYCASGRFVLAPFLDYKRTKEITSQESVTKVIAELEHKLFGRSYLDIHLSTGISLFDIMGIAKHLFIQGRITFGVGRTGNSVSMRLRV